MLEVLSGAKDYESGTAMRNSFVPFFVSMEICPRQFDLGKIGHTNSCFPLGNSHLPLGKMASIYSRMIYYIGSYRKNDVDCSENVVLKKRNNWFMIKTKHCTSACTTLFVHLSVAGNTRLRNEIASFHFQFCGGRERMTANFYFFYLS